MTARTFHLGDILTVTTELLVSPTHMAGVHGLLDFMTGDTLFTHQLPRANDECKPHLLAQHPDLAEIEIPVFTADARDLREIEVNAWLAQQVARFGEYRDVVPLAEGEHTRIGQLTELAMNYSGVQVIPVVVPDGDIPPNDGSPS